MKNIPVSIDDDTCRPSRIKAAESGTSGAALVRACLVGLVQDHAPETEFNRLHRLQDETLEAIRARGGGVRAADNQHGLKFKVLVLLDGLVRMEQERRGIPRRPDIEAQHHLDGLLLKYAE